MLVPLDYANPTGRPLPCLAKRPATSSSKRLGSLIINPGGPGGSGVGYVGYFNAAGLESYDIVGWDPRGVGRSTPVSCFGREDLDRYFSMDSSPDDPGELQARIDAQIEFGQSCLDRSGALLEHISTMDTVRDLDLLRHLLGDSKINYFGSSYGTRIGASMRNCSRSEWVGWFWTVDINSKSKINQVDGFERALRHFASWCADEHCRIGAQRDEVLSKIKDFLDRLDQQPLAVDGGGPSASSRASRRSSTPCTAGGAAGQSCGMRSPPQSSMGMAPGCWRWPTPQIDAIAMAPMGSSTMRFLPFAASTARTTACVRQRSGLPRSPGVRRSWVV